VKGLNDASGVHNTEVKHMVKPPWEGQGKRLQQQSCFLGLLHLQHCGEGHQGENNLCGGGPTRCTEGDQMAFASFSGPLALAGERGEKKQNHSLFH